MQEVHARLLGYLNEETAKKAKYGKPVSKTRPMHLDDHEDDSTYMKGKHRSVRVKMHQGFLKEGYKHRNLGPGHHTYTHEDGHSFTIKHH